MYYKGFDTKITERYGVIIKNWPLNSFKTPSEITTRIELNLLLNAWKSGTTYFYKMSREEYDSWVEQHSRPLLAANSNNGEDTPIENPAELMAIDTNPPLPRADTLTSGMDTSLSAISHLPSSTPHSSAGPLAINMINMGVSGEDGSFIMVSRNSRQPRADKGKPRKPRKKKQAVSS